MDANAKNTAAQFLADHETLQLELAQAKLTLDDQRKEIERLDAIVSVQRDMMAQLTTDKNTYLQYSFELSAQLQFIVSGSARALMIAAQVRNKIALQASGIPPVPGADIAELEDILHKIGEHNKAAGDGHGLTNSEWQNANGAGSEPKPLTGDALAQYHAHHSCGAMVNEIAQVVDTVRPPPLMAGAGPQDIPSELLADVAVMVDRDGNPIELSAATKSMKTAA